VSTLNCTRGSPRRPDRTTAANTDVDATTGRAMAAAMPNGRIEVLPDTGHLPWIDYPDQVADLVRRHVTYT